MTHIFVIAAIVAVGLAGLAVWLWMRRTSGAAKPLAEAASVIINSIGMKMVLIPAGEFMMGSPNSQTDAREDEKPQHRVRITEPFYLGIYPVTQEQYERVMGINPSHCKGDPNRPVERVSWEDASEFCGRLSALPEEKAAGHVYRLPTEAEWEHACRAGSTTPYHFGVSSQSLGDHAWWSQNSGDTTHPVGQKKPNAWGLHDMHGNVCEWCADWYGKEYYSQSPPSDPNGPSSGAWRVSHGGSFYRGSPGASRCAYRYSAPPEYRSLCGGFRVARTLTP